MDSRHAGDEQRSSQVNHFFFSRNLLKKWSLFTIKEVGATLPGKFCGSIVPHMEDEQGPVQGIAI